MLLYKENSVNYKNINLFSNYLSISFFASYRIHIGIDIDTYINNIRK